MIKKNVQNKIVAYRKYNKNDYESYARFCKDNFGKNNYQLTKSYLKWLYDDTNNSFSVAVSEKKIVGIIHNFKAPIILDGELKMVTVLHDLMVNDGYRGAVGFKLMHAALRSDQFAVLPGSIGRLSRAYGRLGSKVFDSYWYRKVQIPRGFFTLEKVKYLIKFQDLARKKDILFGHNKEMNNDFRTRALGEYNKNDCFSRYFDWRFSNKNAPLTFYVTDAEGKNTVLFVIGKRGFLPYVRILYGHSNNKLTLNVIMKFVEKITSRIGIPVILYTAFECPPPSNLKYKEYKNIPLSYVYSKDKNYDFIPKVPTFCSDIGFDGINPF